jgi:hypothetical protein
LFSASTICRTPFPNEADAQKKVAHASEQDRPDAEAEAGGLAWNVFAGADLEQASSSMKAGSTR